MGKKSSVIIFPVEHFVVVILCGALDSFVLGFNESVPFGPAWILLFEISLFIGVPLLIADKLIEVCEHVDEDTGFLAFSQKIV